MKMLDLSSIELRNLGGEDGSTHYYINQDVADLIFEVRMLREANRGLREALRGISFSDKNLIRDTTDNYARGFYDASITEARKARESLAKFKEEEGND